MKSLRFFCLRPDLFGQRRLDVLVPRSLLLGPPVEQREGVCDVAPAPVLVVGHGQELGRQAAALAQLLRHLLERDLGQTQRSLYTDADVRLQPVDADAESKAEIHVRLG